MTDMCSGTRMPRRRAAASAGTAAVGLQTAIYVGRGLPSKQLFRSEENALVVDRAVADEACGDTKPGRQDPGPESVQAPAGGSRCAGPAR